MIIMGTRKKKKEGFKAPGYRISICYLFIIQSLSYGALFATATDQASLSFTVSQSLLKLMSIESLMLSKHPIFCHPFSSCPQTFPVSGSFPMGWLFASGGQSIGASALETVLLMNIQGWFPLGSTGLILQSKELSEVFSNTTVWKHQFFGAQPSLRSNSHIHTWLLEKP